MPVIVYRLKVGLDMAFNPRQHDRSPDGRFARMRHPQPSGVVLSPAVETATSVWREALDGGKYDPETLAIALGDLSAREQLFADPDYEKVARLLDVVDQSLLVPSADVVAAQSITATRLGNIDEAHGQASRARRIDPINPTARIADVLSQPSSELRRS